MRIISKETGRRRYVFDVAGFFLLFLTCIISELSLIPIWLAFVMSLISALLVTGKKLAGSVLGITIVLIPINFKSLNDVYMSFIETLHSVFTFSDVFGARMRFCVLVFLVTSFFISLSFLFRGSHER